MKENDIKAFPCGNDSHILQEGMNLRDYFANSAMQSIITRLSGTPLCSRNDQDTFSMVAEEAYKYADEMVKQRKKL